MAGPWEKYQDAGETTGGPWTRYQMPADAALPAGAPVATKQPPAPAPDSRSGGVLDTIDAAVRGAADFATFGLADEAAAWLASKTGIGGQAGDYEGNLQQQRAIDTYDAQNHPVARGVGQVAGALAVPLGAVSAPTMMGRIGQGAALGAATGGAYGFGSGEGGIADRGQQAMYGARVGALLGGAAPPIISGVQAGARAVGRAVGPIRGFANPEQEAGRRVAGAMSRDAQIGSQGLTRAEFDAAQAAGRPVVLADMGGETTRALARSSANTSPEARAALEQVVSDRFGSQGARVAEDVAGLSPLGSRAFDTLDDLKRAATKANRPAYAKAYMQGASGVWDDELAALTRAPDMADAIRQATRTGANKAVADGFPPVKNPFTTDEAGNVVLRANKDGSTAVPNLQFWDHVKQNLDDIISRHQRTGDNGAARDAINLKNALVEKLDAAVPAYAEARQGAARYFGAQDAVEAGQKFVTATGKNAEYLKAIGKMSKPERAMFAEGFASELASRVRETGDRRNVLNTIYNTPAARQRVQMALGPERAAKLEASLRIEGIMDRLRTAVSGNSTTARQLAEMGLGGGMGLAIGGDWQSAGMGALLARGARMAGTRIDQNVARRVGEMLASSDPKVVEKAVTMAAKQPAIMNAIKAMEAGLARVLGEEGGQMAPSLAN